MPRKRFNAAEKQLIAAPGPGGAVEWQNVAQWHPAVLDSGIARDGYGWESVWVINGAETRGLSKGARVAVGPGHIRAVP
jgi:hypothetical protein